MKSSDWTHRVINAADHASVMVRFFSVRVDGVDQRRSSGPQDWSRHRRCRHHLHEWLHPLQGRNGGEKVIARESPIWP